VITGGRSTVTTSSGTTPPWPLSRPADEVIRTDIVDALPAIVDQFIDAQMRRAVV